MHVRSGRGRLGKDSSAVSGVLAFLIAGVLFMASVAAVLVTTRHASDKVTGTPQDNAAFSIQSSNLADILLGSPGYASSYVSSTGSETGVPNWATGANVNTGNTPTADGLTRLGLLDPNAPEPNMMDFAKFQNLRRAPLAANPTDGYVNYEEAVKELGLSDKGLDFHVRAYPALDSVTQMLQCRASPPPGSTCRDNNLRVTYLGDIDVSNGAPPSTVFTVTNPTCAISPLTASGDPQGYRLSTTVTNNGGVATQFTALFTYKLGTAVSESQNANSYLVNPTFPTTLTVDVPATNGRACTSGSTIQVDVSDPSTARVTKTSTVGTTAGVPVVTGATVAPHDLWVDTIKPYRLNTHGTSCQTKEHAQLSYFGTDLPKNEWMAAKVVDSSNAVVTIPAGASSFKNPNSKGPWTVDLGCIVPGTYTATLYYCGAAVCSPAATLEQVTEQLFVATAAPSPYATAAGGSTTYSPSAAARIEVSFLDTLVQNFCPYYFDSTTTSPETPAPTAYATRCPATAPGAVARGTTGQSADVFPDAKSIMNDALVDRLLYPDDYSDVSLRGMPRYDITNVLVAGSSIDQTAMTSQVAKGTVADWVMGGGTLLVFGSESQNVNWLEPIFHSAIRSSSGGISTPDIAHPILHTPDELDDPAHNYDALGRAWNFNGQTAQAQQDETTALFTNVIVEGGDALTGDPLLADSRPGAIGDGSIILSSYMPYDLYGPSAAGVAKSSQPAGSECPGNNPAGTVWTVGQCEALKFMHNLLMSGYGDLYLDYGPAIPGLTDVQPAVRVAEIRHPDFAEPIELTMIVFVFHG